MIVAGRGQHRGRPRSDSVEVGRGGHERTQPDEIGGIEAVVLLCGGKQCRKSDGWVQVAKDLVCERPQLCRERDRIVCWRLPLGLVRL